MKQRDFSEKVDNTLKMEARNVRHLGNLDMEPLVTCASTVPPWVVDVVNAICNRRLMEVVEVGFQLGSWMFLMCGSNRAIAVANEN